MAELELTITICSWNTRDDLRACLASLQAIRDEAAFEVIVVDNNSADQSAEMVVEVFPWVRLEHSFVNLGFAGGHNRAIAMRQAPHVMPLNSDTIVHPGAIRKLLDFASAHPDYGIIGPKLLNPDGSLQLSCRRFPNPIAALFRNTPIGRLFPKNRFTRDYLMQDWDHTTPREVDWVSGAAFFVRGEVIETVGVFDEAYFMFCEDVDWCWRVWHDPSPEPLSPNPLPPPPHEPSAQEEGGFSWKVVYYPEAVITHAIGRSTDKAPNRMIGRFHRSMLRFYTKNMLPQMLILVRPIAWTGAALAIGMRAGLFITKNKIDNLRRRWGR